MDSLIGWEKMGHLEYSCQSLSTAGDQTSVLKLMVVHKEKKRGLRLGDLSRRCVPVPLVFEDLNVS